MFVTVLFLIFLIKDHGTIKGFACCGAALEICASFRVGVYSYSLEHQ